MVCRNDRGRHLRADGGRLGGTATDAGVRVLANEAEVVISAAGVAEALIVAERRNVGDEMSRLIDQEA
jgi:ribonuclease VapC